jgi:hypothetical protein
MLPNEVEFCMALNEETEGDGDNSNNNNSGGGSKLKKQTVSYQFRCAAEDGDTRIVCFSLVGHFVLFHCFTFSETVINR